MPKRRSLDPEIVNSWPEIFKDVRIDVVPIKYLHSVHVRFKDGKVWEIDVKKSLTKPNLNIETALEDLLQHYESVIDTVDFRLDTAKVKKDIKKRTAIFMKKRK